MKLKILLGGLITGHSLLRIYYLEEYMGITYELFNSVLPFEAFLTVGSVIFPFLEFFVGLLILFISERKWPLKIGFVLSIFMTVILIASESYVFLIYRITLLIMLSFTYFKVYKVQKRELIL